MSISATERHVGEKLVGSPVNDAPTTVSTATQPRADLVPIGRVVRLQIHLERVAPDKSLYECPTPRDHLLPVDALSCDRRGVSGVLPDGSLQHDLHHKDHPKSRFRRANDISLMLLGHYEKIREKFGEHMVDGIAGENMLIDYDGILTIEDLEHGLVIEGDGPRLSIDAWRIATPCSPFSKLATGIPPDEKPDRRVSDALTFLNNGTRGFYGTLAEDLISPVEIRPGDMVYLRKA